MAGSSDRPTSILVLNAGSSSLKFAVFGGSSPPRQVCSGRVERIGLPHGRLKFTESLASEDRDDLEASDPSPDRQSADLDAPDHESALKAALERIARRTPLDSLAAVGHRVVHGGPKYVQPQRATPEVLDTLRSLAQFDPEHLPAEVGLVEAVRRQLPSAVQVLCFDTAFHHDLPPAAARLPIPRRFDVLGVRRYGFHGLSYEFLMQQLGQLGDPAAASGCVVLAHLGNGCSLAAVRSGRPIDTSMAFTPAAGVPMGTRSGDLDPGLVAYLARAADMTVDDFNHMVHKESGLLGVSEISSDMHDLLERQADDARAAEAVEMFCYHVRKAIGGYAAALGGLDTLVFSGGIGEHAAEIRRRVCQGLAFLGIRVDDARNSSAAPGVISPDGADVTVRVIATDEEQMIARHVLRVLQTSDN